MIIAKEKESVKIIGNVFSRAESYKRSRKIAINVDGVIFYCVNLRSKKK